ncbi:MAG: hypothetical protein ACE366_27780 [Bradymonadia bacterium]
MRVWRIATSGGLWGVVVISALVLPLYTHAAAVHRTHWFGQTGDVWRGQVVQTGALIWSILVVLAIAGCVAGWTLVDPRRRAVRSVALGAWPAFVALLASVPGWIWLVRLGIADSGQVGDVLAQVGAAPILTGVVAGAARPWVPMSAAALLGAATGGAFIWWVAA